MGRQKYLPANWSRNAKIANKRDVPLLQRHAIRFKPTFNNSRWQVKWIRHQHYRPKGQKCDAKSVFF
jgi:hypothetical protein